MKEKVLVDLAKWYYRLEGSNSKVIGDRKRALHLEKVDHLGAMVFFLKEFPQYKKYQRDVVEWLSSKSDNKGQLKLDKEKWNKFIESINE